jgi:succinate dehydrogenase/fumarate reductase flavoprotein subunit
MGLSVLIVEKSEASWRAASTSRAGFQGMRENGVHIDKTQFARDWMRICGSRVNEDLLWLYINRSEEAVEWITGLGGDEVELKLYGGHYKGPDFTEYAGTHVVMRRETSKKYKYFGAMLMCEILQDVVVSRRQTASSAARAPCSWKRRTDASSAFIAKGEDGQ